MTVSVGGIAERAAPLNIPGIAETEPTANLALHVEARKGLTFIIGASVTFAPGPQVSPPDIGAYVGASWKF